MTISIILPTSSSPFLSVFLSICGFAVALARLFTGRPALNHVYCTGAITLSGSLQRITGLRSKVAGAALRLHAEEEETETEPTAAITTTTTPTVIIPSGNTMDRFMAEMGEEVILESHHPETVTLDYVRLPKAVREGVRVVSVANAYELLDLALMPIDKKGEWVYC